MLDPTPGRTPEGFQPRHCSASPRTSNSWVGGCIQVYTGGWQGWQAEDLETEPAWSHLTFQLDVGSKSTHCFLVTHRPCKWNDKVFPDMAGGAVLPRTEGPTLWLRSPDNEAPETAALWRGTGEAVGMWTLSYLWMKFIVNFRPPCFVKKLFGADMLIFSSPPRFSVKKRVTVSPTRPALLPNVILKILLLLK